MRHSIMPPRSIRLFTILFWAATFINLVGDSFHWEEAAAVIGEDLAKLSVDESVTSGFIIGLYGFIYALTMLLWFFAAERRSNIARWNYAILMGLACAFTALDMVTQTSEYAASELGFYGATTLISSASIICLFQRDTRDWFARKTTVDTAVFE